MAIWQAFGQYQPGTDFYAWARQVAYHRILNHWRQQNRGVRYLDPDVLELVVLEAEGEDDSVELPLGALLDCVKRLSRDDQHLIQRCYADNASGRQLSDELQRPVNSIYKSFGPHPSRTVGMYRKGHGCRTSEGGKVMTTDSFWRDELEQLLNKLCTDGLTADQQQELNDLLRAGAEQRRYYRQYLRLHAAMKWNSRKLQEGEASLRGAIERHRNSSVVQPDSSFVGLPRVSLRDAAGYFSEGWPFSLPIGNGYFCRRAGHLLSGYRYTLHACRPSADLHAQAAGGGHRACRPSDWHG